MDYFYSIREAMQLQPLKLANLQGNDKDQGKELLVGQTAII